MSRASAGLEDQLGGLERLSEAASGRPRLILTGMGASYHACIPVLNELAAAGVPAHLVNAAELLHFRRAILTEEAAIILVSQSGRSAELVELAGAVAAQPRRPFMASITNGSGNRLADLADVNLDTRAGPEMDPSTVSFAASLVVLAAAGPVLGGEEPRRVVDRTVRSAEDATAEVARQLAGASRRAEQLASWHEGRSTTVLLGRGSSRAASEMGALFVKETAGIPAEAFEAGQFRHGPLELAGHELAAVVFATEPETRDLDLRLAGDLIRNEAAVLVVMADGEAPHGALTVRMGRLERTLSPVASIVPVQLLAWRLALRRGRSPGVRTRSTKVTASE